MSSLQLFVYPGPCASRARALRNQIKENRYGKQ
jgi:hypothetical protein